MPDASLLVSFLKKSICLQKKVFGLEAHQKAGIWH
jgi:hypothetical protein